MKLSNLLVVLVVMFAASAVSGTDVRAQNMPAFGEVLDSVDDVFDTLKYGDRVEVELDNGSVFVGLVIARTKNSLRIDVTLDSELLQGTIEFKKNRIQSLRKLMQLTEEELKKIENVKQQKKDQYKEKISAETDETSVGEGGESEAGEESSEENELLKKFPTDKWTKERYKELIKKADYQLKDDEKEFLKVYEDWVVAVDKQKTANEDKIFEEFPVKDGWSKEKYETLKTQFIRLGVQLTEKEQKFVDNYEKWKNAFERAEKQKTEPGKTDSDKGKKES